MSKPARPGLKFNSLDELVADVDQLRAGGYEQAGQWNLAMIVDHLVKTMRGPFESSRWNIPWPVGPMVRFFFHRIAVRGKYPKMKIKAPKMIQPQADISIEVAYGELLEGVRRLKDVKEETIVCPPFGRLRLEDFLAVQLLHGAHHLSFLRVKEI